MKLGKEKIGWRHIDKKIINSTIFLKRNSMTIKDLQLPLSDYKIGKIGQFYTKEEVDQLIQYAVNEAKRIDDESMRKHNREATMISMALGFTTLALFVDGLLRLLGIVPPFMDINISIIDEIMNKLSL